MRAQMTSKVPSTRQHSWLLRWLPHDASPERIVAVIAAFIACMLMLLGIGIHLYLGLKGSILYAVVVTFLIIRWLYWNALGVIGWQSQWIRDSTAQLKPTLVSEPQQEATLRVVCISDTHNKHQEIGELPDGDILIHCGDFTNKGTHAEISAFNEWLGTLPHRYKIVIAGNHDLSLDAVEYDRHWQTTWKHKTYQDPAISRSLLSNATHYLENRSVVIEGIKVYGSPMTPPIPGRVMAFNVDRGFAAQQHWSKLPSDVDILVTHGPPKGVLDKTVTSLRVGEEALLKEILSRCRPQFHVFGHIHEAYGTTQIGSTVFINCATSTLLRRARHAPIVFDVPRKSATANE